MRSSKNKKEFAKPPVPRRPSEERVRERQKHREKAAASARPAKNDGFKSCFASESCSETYPSDVGLSSDDVFLSSDDTLLNSPQLPKSHATKRRGKKKRKAPMPPSNSSHDAKVQIQIRPDFVSLHAEPQVPTPLRTVGQSTNVGISGLLLPCVAVPMTPLKKARRNEAAGTSGSSTVTSRPEC